MLNTNGKKVPLENPCRDKGLNIISNGKMCGGRLER